MQGEMRLGSLTVHCPLGPGGEGAVVGAVPYWKLGFCLVPELRLLGTHTPRSRVGQPSTLAWAQPGLTAVTQPPSCKGKDCFSCPSPSSSGETALSLLFKTVRKAGSGTSDFCHGVAGVLLVSRQNLDLTHLSLTR